MGEFVIEDRVFIEATRRGEAERQSSPRPRSVWYDQNSGRIIVEFVNGSAFMVPARLLEGLQGASDEQISRVELLGETGLHWEGLDVDFTVSGLMQGIFGTAKFLDAARRGGQSRSEAKATASRTNGLKGGRPRKAN